MTLHTRMSRLKRKLNKCGFTLAEFVITAGILAILASVGFVAVVTYQRQLKATEMDGTAKEIFIAAQNHITALEASGEWFSYAKEYEGKSDSEKKEFFGTSIGTAPSDFSESDKNKYGEWGSTDHEFYFLTVNASSEGTESSLENSILKDILPFGSIDDTVRADGSYVIEYDYKTACVYGVFYTDNKEKISYEDVKRLDDVNGREKKGVREGYKRGDKRIIIGYYGGALAKNIATFDELKAPTVEVENDDFLRLKITDTSYTADTPTKIQLKIVGEESGQKMVCPLDMKNKSIEKIDSTKKPANSASWWNQWTVTDTGDSSRPAYYEFTLDDITSKEGHFTNVCPEFIPGENLIIQVSSSTNYALCTTQTVAVYANSLFANVYEPTSLGARVDYTQVTAEVNCVRHLENLNSKISNVPMNPLMVKNNKNVISAVEQTANIIWSDSDDTTTDFKSTVGDTAVICAFNASDVSLSSTQFLGIYNNALSSYEGNGHSVNGLNIVSTTSNVGFFTQIGGMSGIQSALQNLSVSNLTLNNITVQANGTASAPVNAGILLGEAVTTGTDMAKLTAKNVFVKNPTVSINYGNAGGLAGSLSMSDIQNCGVFGSNRNIDGGSRYYANYSTDATKLKAAVYTANGYAGGMIGAWTGVDNKLSNSFAAVAVASGNSANPQSEDAHIAGGILGANAGSNSEISNSYVGGYTVNGEYSDDYWNIYAGGKNGVAGGFIGSISQQKITITNCYSTASATASTDDSSAAFAGGFIGYLMSQTAECHNCYSTGKVNAKGAGAFSGLNVNGNYDGCYYMTNINEDIILASTNGEISGVTAKSYEVFTKNVGNTSTNTLIYPYDSSIEGVYPFQTVNFTTSVNMANTLNVHYGDWPDEVEGKFQGEIGLIYYERVYSYNEAGEKVYDPIVYYHGYSGNFSSNPYDTSIYHEVYARRGNGNIVKGLLTDSDKYVYEDGYAIVVPTEDGAPTHIRFSINNNFYEPQLTYNVNIAGYSVYLIQEDVYGNYFQYENFVKNITVFDQNDEKDHVISKSIEFKFNPYMGNSMIRYDMPYTKSFEIRSVRQLKNWSRLDCLGNYSDQVFNQTFDIDLTGQGYKTKSLENFCAKYVAKPVGGRTYQIIGLDTQLLFKSNGGTLDGIRIVNAKLTDKSAILVNSSSGIINNCKILKDSNVVGAENGSSIASSEQSIAGMVYQNTGTMTNCSFQGTVINNRNEKKNNKKERSSAAGLCSINSGTITDSFVKAELQSENGYSDVSISARGNTAGFVLSNSGTIKDCFVVGTVTSTESDASGFCYENKGMITYSYSNCLVIANDSASGFVMDLGWNSITIDHCASLLSVTAQEGSAYGFSGSSVGTITNCYNALSEISGKKIYRFSPYISNGSGTQSNCYYLNRVKYDNTLLAPTDAQSIAGEINSTQLSANTNLGTTVLTENTHSYHMTSTYPFPLPVSTGKTPVFWGDWPEEPPHYDYAWLTYEDYTNIGRWVNGSWQQIYGTGDNSTDMYGISGTLVDQSDPWNPVYTTIDTTAHLTAWDWLLSGLQLNYIHYGIAVPKGTNSMDIFHNYIFNNKREIIIHGAPYDFYFF